MEFRREDDGVGTPMSPPGYNRASIRTSAFSRPTLSPSSSLILSPSPRGVSGGGGGLGGGGARNGNCFETASTTATTTTILATPVSLFSRGGIDPHQVAATPSPAVVTSAAGGGDGGGGGAVSGTDLKQSSATSPIPAAKNSPSSTTTRYRECLRNHAATMGGHVVDGCGEFMAGGEEGTLESLKCAACGCHRSFHRRESDSPPGGAAAYYRFGDGGNSRVPLLLPPPPPHQSHHHHHSHHKLQPFHASGTFPPSSPSGVVPGSSATESSSEELNAGMAMAEVAATATGSKKRFRTKFTAEQKEKMMEFAERVGWRIQRQDEAVVERFCSEVGVRRQVLKVWMHNNKHTARRQHQHYHQLPQEQQQQQES